MTTRNVSNLLLKVGGMLIIVLSISSIHSYMYAYVRFSEMNFLLFVTTVIIPNILPLLLGIYMFLKPGKITNQIIKGTENISDNSENLSLLQIQQVCLSTLGFYLLFQAISDLVFHTANFFQAIADFAGQGVISLIFTPEYLATIAEFIFSFWLIFQAKGIVNFVNRMRQAGKQ